MINMLLIFFILSFAIGLSVAFIRSKVVIRMLVMLFAAMHVAFTGW